MTEGDVLVSGVEETGEEYLAELLDDSGQGHKPKPHPIVRILRCIRWPRQRAINHLDAVTEIPPVAPGTVCRMAVIRAATEADKSASQEDAMEEALREARSEEERVILRRHQNGEIPPRLSVKILTPWDVDYLLWLKNRH